MAVDVEVPELPAGLTPQQVAELFFKSCLDNQPLQWLSTIHVDSRSTATHGSAGPFRTCKWEEGRARVEKYHVSYKYVGEGPQGGAGSLTLRYLPVFGDVPGYTPGKALGMEVSLVLKQQGGVGGEAAWRVFQGAF